MSAIVGVVASIPPVGESVEDFIVTLRVGGKDRTVETQSGDCHVVVAVVSAGVVDAAVAPCVIVAVASAIICAVVAAVVIVVVVAVTVVIIVVADIAVVVVVAPATVPSNNAVQSLLRAER